MEEVNGIDVDEFILREIAELMAETVPDITYSAVYDPKTGKVTSIGPTLAYTNETYKVDVKAEIALDVIEGRTKITSCFVDQETQELEVVKVRNAYKIDNVIHRVPISRYSDVEKPDLYVTYLSSTKRLKFELTEELYGTKKRPKKFQPVKQKRAAWAGDTTLTFFITHYNDPHAIIEVIEFAINDLIGSSKIIKNIEVPEKFSIFTRRIFKNYVMDVK